MIPKVFHHILHYLRVFENSVELNHQSNSAGVLLAVKNLATLNERFKVHLLLES